MNISDFCWIGWLDAWIKYLISSANGCSVTPLALFSEYYVWIGLKISKSSSVVFLLLLELWASRALGICLSFSKVPMHISFSDFSFKFLVISLNCPNWYCCLRQLLCYSFATDCFWHTLWGRTFLNGQALNQVNSANILEPKRGKISISCKVNKVKAQKCHDKIRKWN